MAPRKGLSSQRRLSLSVLESRFFFASPHVSLLYPVGPFDEDSTVLAITLTYPQLSHMCARRPYAGISPSPAVSATMMAFNAEARPNNNCAVGLVLCPGRRTG